MQRVKKVKLSTAVRRGLTYTYGLLPVCKAVWCSCDRCPLNDRILTAICGEGRSRVYCGIVADAQSGVTPARRAILEIAKNLEVQGD